LQQFLELCSTFTIQGVEEDAIHLWLFPFSLLGRWSSGSMQTVQISTPRQNAQQHSSRNSFCWAGPMLSEGEFQAFSKQQVKPFQKLGRGIHPSLSPSWDGHLAYSSEFL
jgi:hypothetical protein